MYTLYKNGIDFLQENKKILDQNPLEMAFFQANAKFYEKPTATNYFIKVKQENSELFIMNRGSFNLSIYGEESLIQEAIKVLIEHNLKFKGVLGSLSLVTNFLKQYCDSMYGSYTCHLKMDLLVCDTIHIIEDNEIVQFDANDIPELTKLYQEASVETVHEEVSYEKANTIIHRDLNDIYGIKRNGKIISIAKKTRVEEKIASIALVFTRKEYRHQHYSKKVVTYICKSLQQEGKLVYLYVDQLNPISNHLYQTIGFKKLCSKYDYSYKEGNIQTAQFAGGCFWCLAKPYYSFKGIKKIYSGFAGGHVVEPTYEDVKTKTTGHQECIVIYYDASKVGYEELLRNYFSSIDPFDMDGQFVDRGENYTCAIYTSIEKEKEIFQKIVAEIETQFKRKVVVQLKDEDIFYKAEEYHQDFALKNPIKMQEEMQESGRESYKGVRFK